ncbi:SGNH/GDSL hydrolase family protein [bacterium]|nr:SGNH/GDSL hydrolase family protein [candidate division CSSED10-310 bacterium]
MKKHSRLWVNIYPLYILLVFIALDYAFYLRFRAGLPDPGDFTHQPITRVSHVSAKTMLMLGTVQTGKRSSFDTFSPEKPEGVIRIACFGDSFTYGDEVGSRFDYPTLLQRQFNAHGYDHVQVLNFGVNGYGLHQSYIMWDRVARAFAPEYLIFGPSGYDTHRSTGFYTYGNPTYIHARYILDGDGLALIEPLGTTHRERMAALYRFVPHLRYLRYDRYAPFFLQALLPENRRMTRNPFYYHWGSLDDEAERTYLRLIDRLALERPRVIVMSDDRNFLAQAAARGHSNIDPLYFCMHSATMPHALYYAPGGHYGPMGNDVVARFLFSALTGAEVSHQERVIPGENYFAGPVSTAPLHDLSDLAVKCGGNVVSRLARSGVRYPDAVIEPHLVNERITALVTLQCSGNSLFNSACLPVDHDLISGQELVLWLTGGADERSLPLGRLRSLGGCANLGVVELAEDYLFDGCSFEFSNHLVNPILTADVSGASVSEIRGARLQLGGLELPGVLSRAASEGEPPLRIRFTCDARMLVLAAVPDAYLPQETLAESGMFELTWKYRGVSQDVPLAAWRRWSIDIPVDCCRVPIPRPALGPPAHRNSPIDGGRPGTSLEALDSVTAAAPPSFRTD